MSCRIFTEVTLISDSDNTQPPVVRLSRDCVGDVVFTILGDDRRLTMNYQDIKQALLALENRT